MTSVTRSLVAVGLTIVWLTIIGVVGAIVAHQMSVEFPLVVFEALAGFGFGLCLITLWLLRGNPDPRLTAIVPVIASALPLIAGTAISIGFLAAGSSGGSVFAVLGLVGCYFVRRRWRRKEG